MILDHGLGFLGSCSQKEPDPEAVVANLTSFFENQTTFEEIEQIESDLSSTVPCQAEAVLESRKGYK